MNAAMKSARGKEDLNSLLGPRRVLWIDLFFSFEETLDRFVVKEFKQVHKIKLLGQIVMQC